MSSTNSVSTSSSTTPLSIENQQVSLKPSTAEVITSTEVPDNNFLTAINTSHNSTTIQLPTDRGGIIYSVEKRQYKGNDTVWNSNEIPFEVGVYQFKNLKPNTEYVFKWNSKEPMAPALTLHTVDGCVYNDSVTFGLGETYTVGCASICVCQASDTIECSARCRDSPKPENKNCSVVPDDKDPECCVKYVCQEEPSKWSSP